VKQNETTYECGRHYRHRQSIGTKILTGQHF